MSQKKLKNSSDKPLVSVIIPTIPGRELILTRALDSVMKQTYDNIQLIVITDKSLSSNEARALGVRDAEGKYIAFLDDDDEWDATKIEVQVECMEANPNCGLCTCFSLDRRFGLSRVTKPMDNPDFRALIKSFNLSSTSSYMVRATAFGCVGFDPDLPSAQEYDLALQLAFYGYQILCVPRLLMEQHSTPGQISTNWKRKIAGILAMAEKWGPFYTTKDCLKTVGLLGLFSLAYILDTKIYKLITMVKVKYEQ